MAHIRALRRQPCLRDAQVIFIGEDNLASETQEVAEELIREISGLFVLNRADGRYGVRTDHKSKRYFAFRFGDLLAHDDAIKYHTPLISANPFITNRTPEQKAVAARVEFERQLHSLKRIFDLAPSLTGSTRVVVTGKADHEKKRTPRLKDDMAMAALLGVYWAGEFTGGRIGAKGYADRFLMAHAPSVAPVVRHTEFGGDDFAQRAGVRPPEEPIAMQERLASTEPSQKRQRRS